VSPDPVKTVERSNAKSPLVVSMFQAQQPQAQPSRHQYLRVDFRVIVALMMLGKE